MTEELEQIWSRVHVALSTTIEDPTFRIWLEPLRPVALNRRRLTVVAPPQTRDWVRERFGRALQTAVAAVLGADAQVDVIATAENQDETTPGSASSAARQSTPASTGSPQLDNALTGNPKLTFDQFVIGDSNRLAHAAALAVSELPAQAYNPLFICGPPGVGKTHLLRSIAAFVGAHSPGLTVRLTTGESFTNDFLQALSASRLDAFKASFRRVDLLLIDDVQFLERKAKTEEEFFHTFDSLYETGSQIVLSSDRPPSDLQALEDRLRERFQSGLVADIRAPDLPTRVAILRKRAQHDHIDISALALEAIARRVANNVRALEGALIRVVAYGSLTDRALDEQLARDVLDGLYPRPRAPAPDIDQIKDAACQQFGISGADLVSGGRTPRLTRPRQLAMYLARELTDASLPAIGRAFGGRDHTTVLHALRRTEQRISVDPDCRRQLEQLRALLTASGDRRE